MTEASEFDEQRRTNKWQARGFAVVIFILGFTSGSWL